MSTTDTGLHAEAIAARYLEQRGYRIVARNWKRPTCEIDIIAVQHACAYLVEVKYRAHDYAGSGLEYITTRKLRQMRYAAAQWLAETAWRGAYQLAAIEVTGTNFEVTAFIDSLDIE